MDVNIGLESAQREEIAEILKVLLATTYSFYTKTQNYHWNLVGKEFYSVHLLLQKQYEELAEAIDEMAERVRALGFFVSGGLGIFKEKSLVGDESKVDLSIEEILKSQVLDHEKIIVFIRKALPGVESTHDGATADFLNKRLAVHEKMAWMMRSSL